MTEQTKVESLKLHAIQLVTLKVLKLTIAVNPNIEEQNPPPIEDADFSLITGYSEYDAEAQNIAIKIGVEMGVDQESIPYSLQVELLGVFQVDENRFPLVHLEHWAKTNAPLVLYPYLREHVYSLTLRAGFPGTLLPLFEVPTFRVVKDAPLASVESTQTK